jgi:hypothetical protein
MILCLGVILLFYLWSAIWAALFLMGLFLADVNLGRQHESSEQVLSNSKEKQSQIQPLKERVAFSFVLVISLLILGQPNKDRETAHWPWPYQKPASLVTLKTVKITFLQSTFGSALVRSC